MLKRGDLVFVRGHIRSMIDDLIKIGEDLLDGKGEYTHVAVYLGGNTVAEAQGLRVSGTGTINRYAGDYDIGHIHMTADQREQFLNALTREDGFKYDWLGIFWLVVLILTGYKRKYHEHRHRYCSKYVGWALRQVGIQVNDLTPDSLAIDPIVTIEKG